MIIFALSVSIICLFAFLISFIAAYGNETKKNAELSVKLGNFEKFLDISLKISFDSRGTFKYTYFDSGFNIENTIYIPFEIEKASLNFDKVILKFRFAELYRDNKAKGISIVFDDNTIRYLKMLESQWYNINSPLIIWENPDHIETATDSNVFSNDPQVGVLELTLLEKQDINSFLKYSTISEETKLNLKKILDL